MRKVLIITYYWPPAGGPGVQRILKFVKYLPNFGWQPIILTVKKGEYPAYDESLEKNIPENCKVYKTKSFEPFGIYKRFIGIEHKKNIPVSVLAESKLSWKKRIANWIRLNLFIPDAKRGWLCYAIKVGEKIIQKEKPDLIFTSSPPPTVHLIGSNLAKKFNLKWVADFRDPWTDIHYYENQPRLKITQILDKRLERKVLVNANKVVSVSQMDIELDYSKKISEDKFIFLPNGYDEQDFLEIKSNVKKSEKFTIVHLGIVGKERYPSGLFKSVQQLSREEIIYPENFSIKFIGKVEDSVKDLIKKFDIEKFIEFHSYLPHRESLKEAAAGSMLLLLVTQSKKNIRILPGKTFEYLRMNKPILVLGPEEGETARIIREVDYGKVLEYEKYDEIYKFIKEKFLEWKSGKVVIQKDPNRIKKFERKNLTKELANLFDQLTG